MADWERLGERVVARRVALGHRRREDLASSNGLSMRTLGDLEVGRRQSYHANTLAVLENALRWAPGSIKAILDGGEPTDLPPDTVVTPDDAGLPTPRDATLIKVFSDDRISERDKMKIARILIEDQRRYERERAARAAELIEAFRDED